MQCVQQRVWLRALQLSVAVSATLQMISPGSCVYVSGCAPGHGLCRLASCLRIDVVRRPELSRALLVPSLYRRANTVLQHHWSPPWTSAVGRRRKLPKFAGAPGSVATVNSCTFFWADCHCHQIFAPTSIGASHALLTARGLLRRTDSVRNKLSEHY
jgi:hypothetical protein